MNFKKIACAAMVVAGFSAAGAANASLIQNGNGTFTDTTTGYQWQNISTFYGVATASMSTKLMAGFSFANAAQVLQLQADAPAIASHYFADAAAMGVPHPTPLIRDLIWGVYGDLSNYTWKFSDANQWSYDTRTVTSFADMGAFAVKTNVVPEPASTALLGLGFAGLALIRRRKAK